jgi:hypothetical protein
MNMHSKRPPSSAFESPAATRARLNSDTPGEFHFDDTIDYVTFVAGRLRQSQMKYKHVADGGGMSGSTVSNMASGKTRFPRFGTITGILGALGYETVIRAGGKKP